MLLRSWETALECNFPELNDILQKAEFDPESTRVELVERITELTPQRRKEIKETFFFEETVEGDFESDELSGSSTAKICTLLGIAKDDCWTFDRAESGLADVCAAGDANISYIVDLNESGISSNRGLDVIRLLWGKKSQGTAFILTHEVSSSGEAAKEAELRNLLKESEDDPLGVPICVIAKDRLFEIDDEDRLKESLKVSIKRAGLRKNLSNVVSRTQGTVYKAFVTAAEGLLSIPPEQLEAHVFERGYKEGVSELHVVERILTSHIAQQLRGFFGTDQGVLESTRHLRALREIQLQDLKGEPDSHLAAFRLAEVWESDELINAARTPIACGDVFEVDSYEVAPQIAIRKYIVLAQPCDIALRPLGKERAQQTAFLVPLKKLSNFVASEKDAKLPLLPCKIDDHHWSCDFRSASVARMAILDLASFREDGRVRVDEGVRPRRIFWQLRAVSTQRGPPPH